MPTAIILGLPKPHADRVKGQLKQLLDGWRAGWVIHWQPPTGALHQVRQADIRAALTTARQVHDSAHVLAITNQGGDFKASIASHFVRFFRFRWLPGNWLALPYPAPDDFILNVNMILEDEEDWRARVQPKDIGSSLLLPGTAFATKHAAIWELATRYGDGNNVACERRLDQFEQVHWKPHALGRHARRSLWTDDDLRIFDHTQEQHGIAPEERRWKHSFRIPDGFHYDVRHTQGRKFSVTGARRSANVEANGYVNLDPHGFFRNDA